MSFPHGRAARDAQHALERLRIPAKRARTALLDLLARQAADLIERAQAQQRTRESEERLRQFEEASQDVLWIRDVERLQRQYLTPAFETIYGLSREEALASNNYHSWVDLIVAEDRERATDSGPMRKADWP